MKQKITLPSASKIPPKESVDEFKLRVLTELVVTYESILLLEDVLLSTLSLVNEMTKSQVATYVSKMEAAQGIFKSITKSASRVKSEITSFGSVEEDKTTIALK